MTVELAPYEEFEFDGDAFASAADHYCGNCVHVEVREGEGGRQVYCTRWEDDTRIEPGWVCEHYVPQGFGDPE